MRWLFRRFHLSPNGYYNYQKNTKAQYQAQKKNSLRKIVEIYHKNNGVPGYRMMAAYLRLDGIYYSDQTIYKYMKELGLRSIVRRKKPHHIKGNAHKVFPDLLNQDFDVTNSSQVWVTDFTYMPFSNGSFIYNCTIIDLFKRKAVATLNGSKIDAKLALDTLALAISRNTPPKGLILHSDQGSQFTSKVFVEYCMKHHIQQSMSRAGCPYDNAPMERFFNTFKNEFYNLYDFKSAEMLNRMTYDFVYIKYNNLRPHQYNDGLPPNVALRVA